jgi:cysteinyl-tRNA synthetase
VVLRLYNTLTHEKDDFRPLDPGHVRMYVCGPTVYDYAHIGNARPVIVFDVLYRLLKHLHEPKGARVTYVRNITDVEDKINARAAETYPDLPPEEAIRRVTTTTFDQFSADVDALGCLPPSVEPRATESIAEMIEIARRLIASGHAYAADGHVLFHVPSMPDYGRLARRSLDDMIAGARIDVAPYKRDPMDFVLWKPSGPDEPGWDSPWGRGRPGWHIECSAMAWKHLGETFDIHGGGIDLVFPHHENEIAQSRCAFHQTIMAQVFMHNGFLQVEGEKMSKSLGNFVTIRELLNDWPGEVLRLNMLRTHYRQPTDWTLKGVEESARTLDDWYWFAADAAGGAPAKSVIEALSDDLNTPKAIAELHALRNAAQRAGGEDAHAGFVGSLRLLGFLGETAEAWAARKKADAGIDPAAVERLVAARLDARKRRDFAESDRIRDELAAMNVVLKDSKDPKTGEVRTDWEVKR